MVHAHLDRNSTSEVTAAAVIANNAVVRGDGGGRGIQSSGVTLDDSDNLTGINDMTGVNDITANSITLTTALAVAYGGTGAATLTGVLTGNGTSAVTANAVTQYGVLVGDASNAVTSTSVGTSTHVLTSNGAGVAPTFQVIPPGLSGSTGATDNAVLRADGTGGSSLQNTGVTISDGDIESGMVQHLAGDGSGGAPTYSYALETDTGWYSGGTNTLSMSVDGSPRIHYLVDSALDGSGIAGTLQINYGSGAANSVSKPIYSFRGDANTGIYRVADEQLGFTTGGVTCGNFSSGQVLTLTNALVETSGGTGLAAYTAGDILYSDAANSLAVLAIGSDDEVLTLASGLPSWAAATGSFAWTSITSGSLTGAALTVTSGLGAAHDEYLFILTGASGDESFDLDVEVSDDAGVSYAVTVEGLRWSVPDAIDLISSQPIQTNDLTLELGDAANLILYINGNNTANYKTLEWNMSGSAGASEHGIGNLNLITTADIDGVKISVSAGEYDAGTYVVYGR